MPSPWTFTIQPIAKLIARYVGDGIGWVDPFAGENSPAELTNDLNPERPAKFHMHAKDFALSLDGKYKGVLFDPPYSLRQTKECYEGIGYGMSMEDTQSFPNNVKKIIANKIDHGGIAICFVCHRKEFSDMATVGHYVKRRHLITRWDLLNCNLICPDCQDEGNPANDARYAAALDEYYGAGTAELLKAKSHQAAHFTNSELSELLENFRNQLKNA